MYGFSDETEKPKHEIRPERIKISLQIPERIHSDAPYVTFRLTKGHVWHAKSYASLRIKTAFTWLYGKKIIAHNMGFQHKALQYKGLHLHTFFTVFSAG